MNGKQIRNATVNFLTKLTNLPTTLLGYGISVSDTLFDTKYEAKANKNTANGYVGLNGSTKIDAEYLPSFVDDLIEVADFASLPLTGETGKIYLTLDDNKIYRWSGSVYVEISAGAIPNLEAVLSAGNKMGAAQVIRSADELNQLSLIGGVFLKANTSEFDLYGTGGFSFRNLGSTSNKIDFNTSNFFARLSLNNFINLSAASFNARVDANTLFSLSATDINLRNVKNNFKADTQKTLIEWVDATALSKISNMRLDNVGVRLTSFTDTTAGVEDYGTLWLDASTGDLKYIKAVDGTIIQDIKLNTQYFVVTVTPSLPSVGDTNTLYHTLDDDKLKRYVAPNTYLEVHQTFRKFTNLAELTPSAGSENKLYLTEDNNKLYRWNSTASTYVEVSGNSALTVYPQEINFNSLAVTGAIGSTGAFVGFPPSAILNEFPKVFLNGLKIKVGIDQTPANNLCFFSPDGIIVRQTTGQIQDFFDKLYWNPAFANSFDLTTSDEICIDYSFKS